MTTPPPLLACPFCWKAERLFIGQDDHGTYHFGSCGTCGAEGPISQDENEAIAAWNKRVPAPAVASPLLASLVERLRKTESILRSQADYARRIAETYAPESERWNEGEGDDRLTAMIRYQLDQESLARSLTKDADETAEAATALEALAAENGALREALRDMLWAFVDSEDAAEARSIQRTDAETAARTTLERTPQP